MTMPVPEAFLEAVINSEVKRFTLDPKAVCSIGRGVQNTIVLADNQVSRNHAMVQCTQTGEYYLTDLGSRNGTLVNQRRATSPVGLRRGDRVAVGSCEFTFHGGAEPEQDHRSEAGETVVDFAERMITVLVADIRDFTGLSRRLSEASLSEVISAFIRDSGTVLSSKGAWGQKYIGDAVMAIWVHAHGEPDLPDMLAVFESLLHLFDVAGRMQDRFGLDAPIRIGAGINTGLACVGNMGSEASADYTALSDAVNLTFRLESATKEIGCDLALGPASYDFLASRIATADLFQPHTMQLKGYREPRLVYAASRASVAILLEELRKNLPSQVEGPATHA
jgi:adenylate cyclase